MAAAFANLAKRMHTFRVWAPLPRKVEVQVGGQRHAMRAGPDGWWTAEVPSARPGSDYGFVLDGEGPFPDPRSPWQPNGVHGLSRLRRPRRVRVDRRRLSGAAALLGA